MLVPSEAPPVFVAVWEVGPTLAWFALGLLGVGAAMTALAIFRPTHNRLRALEEAATALGQGRTDVRAAEGGGDEVSSLARTFNRMAEDLEARAAALSASDRARRQLLADVSHELMTPLTAIRGYTETLGMGDLRLDEPTRGRYLAIIGEETQKLEELIGDLLDLARLEGGGGTLAFKNVAVSDLFGRVIDRHGPIDPRPPDHGGRSESSRRISRSGATRSGSSRRCRTSPPMRCGTRPKGARSSSRAEPRADGVHITRRRLRRRHSAGAPAARLRSLLQGRPVADRSARHVDRQRARPLHRAGDRRAPRRTDRGVERAEGRRDVRDRPAGARVGTQRPDMPHVRASGCATPGCRREGPTR